MHIIDVTRRPETSQRAAQQRAKALIQRHCKPERYSTATCLTKYKTDTPLLSQMTLQHLVRYVGISVDLFSAETQPILGVYCQSCLTLHVTPDLTIINLDYSALYEEPILQKENTKELTITQVPIEDLGDYLRTHFPLQGMKRPLPEAEPTPAEPPLKKPLEKKPIVDESDDDDDEDQPEPTNVFTDADHAINKTWGDPLVLKNSRLGLITFQKLKPAEKTKIQELMRCYLVDPVLESDTTEYDYIPDDDEEYGIQERHLSNFQDIVTELLPLHKLISKVLRKNDPTKVLAPFNVAFTLAYGGTGQRFFDKFGLTLWQIVACCFGWEMAPRDINTALRTARAVNKKNKEHDGDASYFDSNLDRMKEVNELVKRFQ